MNDRAPWVVSDYSSDGTQPWSIGIEGKGPREWFDTRADAGRAVRLLNAATMPPEYQRVRRLCAWMAMCFDGPIDLQDAETVSESQTDEVLAQLLKENP